MYADTSRYNSVARFLHWVIAFLILGNFIGGWLMTHEGFSEDFQFNAFQLHKSFGFVVLILSIFRLFWRVAYRAPPTPIGMPVWEKVISKITHIAFYVLMIGVPVIGWIYVSASPLDIPTKLFFTVPVPHLPVPVDEGLAELFSGFHEFFAFATLGLFVLHVGAAAKHYFISRDNIMQRMAGRGFGPLLALLFAAVMGGGVAYSMVSYQGGHEEEGHDQAAAEATSAEPEADATEATETAATETATDNEGLLVPAVATGPNAWAIIEEETFIDVTAFANGAPRIARMDDVQGAIELNLDEPQPDNYIDVLIGTRSLESDDSNVRMQATAAGWLNTPRFPQAHFVSRNITRTGELEFEAIGDLTLRDITAPVTLTFSVTLEDNHALATGLVEFDRANFDIGDAQPENTSVTVSVQVGADRVR